MPFGFTPFIYKMYERRLWSEISKEIEKGNHPKHIAIIMDGNRRYARKMNLPGTYGHVFGRERLKGILKWLWQVQTEYVTLFAFSTENANRSKNEVATLMKLATETFKSILDEKEFQEKKVRVKTIGRIKILPQELKNAIQSAEDRTKNNDGPTLIIAIGYGGRAEMIDAIKSIAKKVENKEITSSEINERFVEKHLYTNGIPDPDLIIRTSGEERLSGFLIWQAAYSELYFTDVFFPEFRKIDLWRAIRTYQKRQRRYGK